MGDSNIPGGNFIINIMDAAFTNGSRIHNIIMVIDPNVPIEIHTGMEITVGQTIMRVTLLAN